MLGSLLAQRSGSRGVSDSAFVMALHANGVGEMVVCTSHEMVFCVKTELVFRTSVGEFLSDAPFFRLQAGKLRMREWVEFNP